MKQFGYMIRCGSDDNEGNHYRDEIIYVDITFMSVAGLQVNRSQIVYNNFCQKDYVSILILDNALLMFIFSLKSCIGMILIEVWQVLSKNLKVM